MWSEFQQLSCVTTDYGRAAGTVIPPGENGFITFPRLSATPLGCPAPAWPNLTATIAWRLTANNRASRQTHPSITAAEHKISRPQVSHQYHRQPPAKPSRAPSRTGGPQIRVQKERNAHSAPRPKAGPATQITKVSLLTEPTADACPSRVDHSLFHRTLARAIDRRYARYSGSQYFGIPRAKAFLQCGKRRVPRAERGARVERIKTSPNRPACGAGRPCRCAPR